MVEMLTLNEISGPSNRCLLLVHGRDFKPGRETYMDLSIAALRAGIERDYPQQLDGFDAVQKHIAWYADLGEKILLERGRKYDLDLDTGDRRNALNALRQITPRKRFGIRQYDRLPGKSALPEFIADLAAPLLGSVGLAMPVLGRVAADFAAYFDTDTDFAEKVRERVRAELCACMDRDDRIMLIAHGTGSVIVYDVLCQLSHDPQLKERYGDKKIEILLTLGSPLGDSSVQKRLYGAQEKAECRFPANVISWHNVSAEDDYTCHDDTLADDYRKMLKKRLVSTVHDYHVFNLAVRYGKSNPHSSVGYYIHPRTTKIISDWLRQ